MPEQMTVSSLINDFRDFIKAKRHAAAEHMQNARGILSAADSVKRAAIAAANEQYNIQEAIADGIAHTAAGLETDANEAEHALKQILGNV